MDATVEKIAILDFEASSLSEASWPIEIGLSWLDHGEVRTWSSLIRPAPDWAIDDWSPQSASVPAASPDDSSGEAVGGGVVAGHAVARAGHEAEELRHRVDEVEHLRHEEEQQRLRVVPEDRRDGEGHPGEVAVGVADEDLRREPVVPQQRARDGEEREEQVSARERASDESDSRRRAGGQAGPVHFGLGQAETAEVRVTWPDGTTGDWQEIRAGQVLRPQHFARVELLRVAGRAVDVAAGARLADTRELRLSSAACRRSARSARRVQAMIRT